MRNGGKNFYFFYFLFFEPSFLMRVYFIRCAYRGINRKTYIDAYKAVKSILQIIIKSIQHYSCLFRRMKDLSLENKHLKLDNENAEHKINKLSKTVQDREIEIVSLVETIAK